MNRRGFLSSLGLAIVGTGVAYSFPDIIVPKNIIISAPTGPRHFLMRIADDPIFGFGFSNFQESTEQGELLYWVNDNRFPFKSREVPLNTFRRQIYGIGA